MHLKGRLYMLHCLLGNIWAWINPWTGVWNLVVRNPKGLFNIPLWVEKWLAIVLFFLFYLFIIVDLAPDDPARLAIVVSAYLSFNFLGIALFGRQSWMNNVECFTVLFTLLSRLAPLHYVTRSNTWRLDCLAGARLQKNFTVRGISSNCSGLWQL